MGGIKPEQSSEEVATPISAGARSDSGPSREAGVMRKPHAEISKELGSEAISSLARVSPAVAEINSLITDLQAARNYLQWEGDRIQREVRRYAELGQAASESVKIITENLSAQWRREHGARTRSQAIRQLVEQSLAPAQQSIPVKIRAEAAALAERQIDRLADPSADSDERTKRKHLLVKGPPELRRRRRDD